ncbi:MAG: AI-2E family transporter [Clostridia bacterium]|nr:AI-2E family transporter [Clostridia bacterium]
MKENLRYLALLSVGTLSAGILLICFIKYLFPVLTPFLIAWLVASVTVTPAKRLAERIKAPERIIRLVSSLLIALIFVASAVLILWRTTTALWSFLVDISEQNRLYDLLTTLLSKDIPFLGGILPEELASRVSEAFDSVISSVLSTVAGWVTTLAGGVPQLFFFMLVTLISLVYFALDYDKITDFVKSALPEKAVSLLSKCRTGVITVLKKYVLSYSLIMLITYITLLTGFLILGISHAAVVALFIAILDILPVLGVGTVLVPWSIYELAVGNGALGIGLIVLFVVNSVIRQLSEPKIVGKSLDIHPLLTLIMLYVGYSLFGIFGMLLLPVAAVCISSVLKGNKAADVA